MAPTKCGALPELAQMEEPFMLSKEFLLELLQLGEGWELAEIRSGPVAGTLTVAVRALSGHCNQQACVRCHSQGLLRAEHAKKQVWRHLDGFNHKTLIECDLPRLKCQQCGHRFQVKPAWQGRSRYFTKNFEAYALSLIRETSVRGASRVLCESDQRLWRMLFAYVEGVHGELSTVAISIPHREWNKQPK